jgi:hypothetical protein
MTTFVYRNGKLVDKRVAPPKEGKHGSAAFVISDEMAPTRHMADGKFYTSKVKFRQATRDHNCIEVGTETATLLKPRKPIELDRGARREAIQRTIYEMRNRGTT